MLRVIGLVVPLCLDTFAVASALGITGMGLPERLRVGLLFTAFEGGMPLIGLLAGAAAGRLAGGVADYIAIAVLAALGSYMLLARDEKDEAGARKLVQSTGVAMIGLGLSISLDELAIGFTLGLVGVSVALAVALIAVQAFVVSQIGFQVGRHVGERFREGAERLAGVVLIALGAVLLVSKLTSTPV